MSKLSYNDLLKFPQWKKKCREILKRDHFKCTACGSTNNLQVHHTFYYDNFLVPWKYPNGSLLSVCGDCHKKYHEVHENEVRHYVKIKPRVKKHQTHKVDKSKLYPERQLTKIKKGKGYIYELKTIWIKKTA